MYSRSLKQPNMFQVYLYGHYTHNRVLLKTAAETQRSLRSLSFQTLKHTINNKALHAIKKAYAQETGNILYK
jgi:hypothetical protein